MNTSPQTRNQKKAILWTTLIFVGIIGYIGYHHIYANMKTYIYNPKDEAITVDINNTPYTVEKNSSLPVSLLPGEHTIIYEGKTEVFQKKWVNTKLFLQKRTSFLDPTKAGMIVKPITYGKGNAKGTSISGMYTHEGKRYISEDGFVYEFSGVYAEVNYLWNETLPDSVWLFGGAFQTTYYQAVPVSDFIRGKEGVPIDPSIKIPNLQYTY